MKTFLIVVLISVFVGVVSAIVYGAVQVSAGTWDTAVIMLTASISANVVMHGFARVIAARHPPQPDNRQITTIDKAVIMDRENKMLPW